MLLLHSVHHSVIIYNGERPESAEERSNDINCAPTHPKRFRVYVPRLVL